MQYRIEFSRPASRQFDSLPKQVQLRLKPRLDSLRDNPRPHGAEKMAGEEELYRLRVGDYRVIYQIRDQALVVLVVKIGHRKDVYRR